jgi:hypothetical protein
MFKAWKSRQLNVAVCMSGGDLVVPAFLHVSPQGVLQAYKSRRPR